MIQDASPDQVTNAILGQEDVLSQEHLAETDSLQNPLIQTINPSCIFSLKLFHLNTRRVARTFKAIWLCFPHPIKIRSPLLCQWSCPRSCLSLLYLFLFFYFCVSSFSYTLRTMWPLSVGRSLVSCIFTMSVASISCQFFNFCMVFLFFLIFVCF